MDEERLSLLKRLISGLRTDELVELSHQIRARQEAIVRERLDAGELQPTDREKNLYLESKTAAVRLYRDRIRDEGEAMTLRLAFLVLEEVTEDKR